MTSLFAPVVAVTTILALAEPVRPYRGPTEAEAPPASSVAQGDLETNATGRSEPVGPTQPQRPPPPRPVGEQVSIAVGLSPSAPGTKDELRHLEALERTSRASSDPKAQVRRLRPGTASAREVCRARRDDLVVQIGYVPDRPEPVVIAHDCVLDVALQVRAVTAAHTPELLPTLWAEHRRLVDEGYKERRRLLKIKPGVRIALISSAVAVVLGVAVGVLVASTLREEKVVLKVSP